MERIFRYLALRSRRWTLPVIGRLKKSRINYFGQTYDIQNLIININIKSNAK